MSDCKRSCCWTPFGTCARSRQGCACHITQEMKDAALQALRDQQIQNRLTRNAVLAGNRNPDINQGGH